MDVLSMRRNDAPDASGRRLAGQSDVNIAHMSLNSRVSIVSHKVGLNGVTFVKTHKNIPNRHFNRVPSPPKERVVKTSKEAPTDTFAPEESWNLSQGVLTSDEFGDVNSNHKTLTLSRLTRVSDANLHGKLGAGNLLEFFEETGAVLCTRYCNYTAADQSLRNGSVFDQVHCGMVYLEFLEMLLPAHAGQLLTCVADIYYTAAHVMEIKCVIWAEDLVSCSRRLVCKASAWYVAFNTQNDWRLTRIPKLSLDPKVEREGAVRYEKYKENRREYNTAKIDHSTPEHDASGQRKALRGVAVKGVKHSELVLTHVASIHDCGTHMYTRCGAIVDKIEECAALVARRHSEAQEVAAACGYHFNFLELIPRGSLLIIFARLIFTSRRIMEVEVLVDMEVVHDESLDMKRVAAGYLCYTALDSNGRMIPVPNIQIHGEEEENRFTEGQKRFDDMRKHLQHTEAHIAIDVGENSSERKPVVGSIKFQ